MNPTDVLQICELEQQRLTSRVVEEQRGVPTFFDQLLLEGIQRMRALAGADRTSSLSASESTELDRLLAGLSRYQAERQRLRLVPFRTRLSESRARPSQPWELSAIQSAAMQGVGSCLQWRGMPLFKSVFDFALYPMILWEVKPRTILELGSGSGASAAWLRDLATGFAMEIQILSVDRKKVSLSHPGVSFLQGDCHRIADVLPPYILQQLPHPWIVIEDAHVNTEGIIHYFSQVTSPGDYLIIEDSENKQDAILRCLGGDQSDYAVDSRYTDFFGYNATSAVNSILVRVGHEH